MSRLFIVTAYWKRGDGGSRWHWERLYATSAMDAIAKATPKFNRIDEAYQVNSKEVR